MVDWFSKIDDYCVSHLSGTYRHLFGDTRAHLHNRTLCLKLAGLHQLPPGSVPYLEGPKDIELILREAQEICKETSVKILDATTGMPYEDRGGYLKKLRSISIGREVTNVPEHISQIFWAYAAIKSRLGR